MRKLDEPDWVAELLRPGTRVEVNTSGLPFRLTQAEDWDTGVRKLTEHLIYFVAAGRCRATVDGRDFVLQAGELCWVCPDVTFRFSAGSGRTAPVLQRFRLTVSRGGVDVRLRWSYRVFRDAAEAVDWARELAEGHDAGGRFGAAKRASLAALFSIGLFERRGRLSVGRGLPRDVCRRISRHVLDHAEERLSPAGLARVAGLSPDYFARLFRKSFGASPREWLVRQRLRHAAGLLAESDCRVSEVATRLGYPDLYLFSRQFKNEFGRGPRAWRQAHAAP